MVQSLASSLVHQYGVWSDHHNDIAALSKHLVYTVQQILVLKYNSLKVSSGTQPRATALASISTRYFSPVPLGISLRQ